LFETEMVFRLVEKFQMVLDEGGKEKMFILV
jgi:hypothetical protein